MAVGSEEILTEKEAARGVTEVTKGGTNGPENSSSQVRR
jgi:hypothetical protein